jgi:single-strand DNA-binding protein
VILIGRLAAAPEVTYTQSGKAVARYRLAVDRHRKKDSQKETDFITCVVWDKGAEFASSYLHKGTKIAVEGRIHTGSYEKDGVKHYTTDVIVERQEFCESKNAAQTVSTAADNNLAYLENKVSMFGNQTTNFSELDEDDGELPF